MLYHKYFHMKLAPKLIWEAFTSKNTTFSDAYLTGFHFLYMLLLDHKKL